MSDFSAAFLYELSYINSMRFLFVKDYYLRCRYYVQSINIFVQKKETLLLSCKLSFSNLY